MGLVDIVKGAIGGAVGYMLTAAVAPYAAPAWYALDTGLGTILGYQFKTSGSGGSKN